MSKKDGGGVIRVLVAASSAVRRGGLEAIVCTDSSLQLSGSVSSVLAFDARVRELEPDVIVADLSRPDPQFVSAVSSLDQAGIAVVALIDDPNAGWTTRALRAGVRAILPQESSAAEILSAIHAASNGLVVLDSEIVQEWEWARSSRSDRTDPLSGNFEELTAREVEVLRFMAEGFSNKEIASRLGISGHTVKFHISSILGKLGATTRTEAVTLGIRMGLILL